MPWFLVLKKQPKVLKIDSCAPHRNIKIKKNRITNQNQVTSAGRHGSPLSLRHAWDDEILS